MEQSGVSLSEILMVSMVGLFMLAMGVILFFVIHQRRMIAKDLLQKQLESNYQKDLLKAIINSQERERNRIAHDLHDEIGTLLTTSRIYFNQLSPGHAEEQLQQVSNKMNLLFDEMMTNIRRISHDLRPVVLENFGLQEALESLREKLTETGLEFNMAYHLTFQLSSKAELILYRILQELINNTLKHARATAISIDIETIQEKVHITYGDDGIGFVPSHTTGGLGMKSIESRLTLLNSTMNRIAKNKGSHFFIQIDIQNLTRHE